MKSLYFLFAALLLSVTSLNAQLAPGSWAPPFTLTDIEGNEHRLYDYLADGKAVIIDLAAAWCSPCWTQHQSEVLHQVWEEYGPNGTDEIMIFFIESDPNTTSGQLDGSEGPSMGNWVEGTPYPIIDVQDFRIPAAYNLNAYPTITLICPDMRVKVPSLWSGLNNWTVDYVVNQALSCEDNPPLENDAIIHSYDIYGTDCYNGSLDYKLINGGTQPLTSAEISLKQDGQVLDTYNWEGELAFGDEAQLYFDDILLEEGQNEFTIEWEGSDTEEANNSIMLPFHKAVSARKDIVVYAQMDENAEEDNTRWYIENENGEVVAQSGAPENDVYSETELSLDPEGCYRIVLEDEGRDGLGSSGFLLFTDTDGTEILNVENFGEEAEVLFLVQSSVNVNNVLSPAEIGFSVWPNPVSNNLSIKLDIPASSQLTVECINLTGQWVSTLHTGLLPSGNQTLALDMADYPAGIYFLRAITENGQSTLKVVKE